MKKRVYLIIIIMALIGLIISSYLTYTHYNEKNVVCVSNEHSITCDAVLNGIYSSTFNIPNSLIGLFGFLFLLILGLMKKDKLLLLFSSIALVFMLYLAYLILFVIKSFCIWCFVAWIIVIIIFVCSLILKKK